VETSKDMLDSSKCYLLDCGTELYIWAGRSTSLDARKAAVSTVEASPLAIYFE
jgi:gelsolin